MHHSRTRIRFHRSHFRILRSDQRTTQQRHIRSISSSMRRAVMPCTLVCCACSLSVYPFHRPPLHRSTPRTSAASAAAAAVRDGRDVFSCKRLRGGASTPASPSLADGERCSCPSPRAHSSPPRPLRRHDRRSCSHSQRQSRCDGRHTIQRSRRQQHHQTETGSGGGGGCIPRCSCRSILALCIHAAHSDGRGCIVVGFCCRCRSARGCAQGNNLRR